MKRYTEFLSNLKFSETCNMVNLGSVQNTISCNFDMYLWNQDSVYLLERFIFYTKVEPNR